MTTLSQKYKTKLVELRSLKLLFTVVASVTFVLTGIDRTIVIFFILLVQF